MYSCSVSWISGSSNQLHFKATSPTQVIKFLNNSDGKCFLLSDSHMGPNLTWFFQDWKTKELISANAQGKLPETLISVKYQCVLQTIDYDSLYMVKVCSKHTFLCSHSSSILYQKRKGDHVQYASLKSPDLLEDIKSALHVKLGAEEYQLLVSNQYPKTRSIIKRVEESASQP